MLYLEDYLEMIENLPMEMRDRFTEMREMDLQVQNAMDSLEDRVKTFFKKCGSSSPKPEWQTEQLDDIKQEYGKALEDADEKVQMANQMHELVERHLRKLDQEVSKFKMELEADNAGITEVLEKRSLELDRPPQSFNNHRAEKRRYIHSMSHVSEKKMCTNEAKVFSSVSHDPPPEAISTSRQNSTPASPSATIVEPSSGNRTPSLSYSLGQVGAGSNAAINLAASRAIGATLGMQQGRRTSSLKASYEAVNKKRVDLSKELSISKETPVSMTPTAAATPSTSSSRTETLTASTPSATTTKASRTKKSSRAEKQQKAQQLQQEQEAAAAAAAAAAADTQPAEETVDVALDENSSSSQWQHDPNEPRYCTCNDVSYGEMVGCDNEDCPIEWFHYGCVGLSHAPKGKWYCPQCLSAMKRRGRK